MANSSRTQVRIYKESVWGETPSTSNKMANLNVTAESLSQKTSAETSKNIRSDTNVSSVNRVGISTDGDISVEINFGTTLDQLFEGVMRSTFGTAAGVTAATTVAFVPSGNKITHSGAGFTNIQVGQWIKVSGAVATAGANNGYYKVTAKASASEITVAGKTVITEAAGPAITIKGAFLKNGTTDQSFLIEVERADVVIFKYFTGMRVGQAQFTFAPNALVTGSFSFVGKQMFVATATKGDGSPTAAATTRSMNAVDNIKGVYKDGSLSTLYFTNFSFSISSGLRPKNAIGNLAAVGIGSGTVQLTVNLEAYLEDNTLLTEYLAFTQTGFTIVAEDFAGNAYAFDFPALVPTSGEDGTGGIDQDLTLKMTYQGFLDASVLNAAVGITRM